MSRIIAAAGLLVGASLLSSAPAFAHGNVQWSVTVGTPGYYQPPGVVVYPQQFIYGPPPSAFEPPPPVIYYTPPAPVYRVYPPPVQYVEPYVPRHHGHHRHDRDGWYDDRPRGFRR